MYNQSLPKLSDSELRVLRKHAGRSDNSRATAGDVQDILMQCDLLGEGCGRIAYLINHRDRGTYVFKFANCSSHESIMYDRDELDGLAQTLNEVEIYKQYHREWAMFVPTIFDWARDGRWIEMEYLTNVNQHEFANVHGFACKELQADKWWNRPALSDSKFRSFIRESKLSPYELGRLDHWGRSSIDINMIKIRDMGLTYVETEV